jgi:predicted ATP-dependent serine protease
MPRCPFCGHDNPASLDRCPSCGAWIGHKAEGAAPQPEQAPESGGPEPDSLEGQVFALMQGRKKIEAIKLYRQQTGAGLKEAKDAVEALAAKHGIIATKGAGCAGMVLLMVVVSIGVWVMLG